MSTKPKRPSALASEVATEDTPILNGHPHSSLASTNNLPHNGHDRINEIGRQRSKDDKMAASQTERHLRNKIDLRLCTIAGLLCSLNLLDSGIISSAAVTSMLSDLDLTGNRYSVSIFIFTVASITFQLPSTITMRLIGPRIFFSIITTAFGLITLCTAFITTWRQMIVLRILLGISMSGIYPGLTYLLSTYYTRHEQQLRFAFLQSGEVFILATGSLANFGLNHLDHHHGLRGWQWMYIVQGSITITIGLVTYFWMVDFPEKSQSSFHFLTPAETRLAIDRINADRADAGTLDSNSQPIITDTLTTKKILVNFLDPKLYMFSTLFFLLNLVSTSLSYFLPIILQGGFHYSPNNSILLSAPPYYYSIMPVLITSWISDRYQIRGPVIVFNAVVLIVGFLLLGFLPQTSSTNSALRYVGVYLATGSYVSNWAALSAYMSSNIRGHTKRLTLSAAVSACNGLGGIAGSYIVRREEAPRYLTAIWASLGSHVLMVLVVGGMSVWFWVQNKHMNEQEERRGGDDGVERNGSLQQTDETVGKKGWRYTY